MFSRLTKCMSTNASFQNIAHSRNFSRNNVSLHSNTTVSRGALNSTVNWSSNKVCVFSQTKLTKNKKTYWKRNVCLSYRQPVLTGVSCYLCYCIFSEVSARKYLEKSKKLQKKLYFKSCFFATGQLLAKLEYRSKNTVGYY